MNTQPIHIHVVFGTRPEAIKVAPVIKVLQAQNDIALTTVFTAQHRELATPILDFFAIAPDVDFDSMEEAQTPTDSTAAVLRHMQQHFAHNHADWVVVQGDTTTAMAAALAAFYNKIPVAHIEAGLRTHNRYNPFPEEMNRRLISSLATLHCAATQSNRENLLAEGVADAAIAVTGNPVIDALHSIVQSNHKGSLPFLPTPGRKLVLLTTHRRENFGEAQQNIFRAVRRLLQENEILEVVFPVHPNPTVRNAVAQHLPPHDRLHIINPLNYIDFIRLLHQCNFVMSDSGGLQEEAPALGKPILVLRSTTERPEILDTGTALLTGTDEQDIINAATLLLADEAVYARMAQPAFPFGTGNAAQAIAKALRSATPPAF